ncbi:MAG: hypothetical protein KDB23_33725, partial [Planctomycetales bacterium]|nr:hypothetical protein [Planctomycetales bacterium]
PLVASVWRGPPVTTGFSQARASGQVSQTVWADLIPRPSPANASQKRHPVTAEPLPRDRF